ncbi:MAG: FAD-dependent oxidoreductase [Candidatus Omnitrophica bacterium]|nr:FAD-dependent oxidoreductase [Candidatus Omnitrophota bacterium]
MKHFDAIVVGAGISGFGTAIALAKRRKKVLILEKKGIRGEATPRSAGILDPVLELYPKSPILSLTFKAFREYPKYLRHLGKKIYRMIDFEQMGMLYIARDAKEEKALKEKFLWQKKIGMPVRWLRRDEVLKYAPAITPSVCSGLFYPTVAKLNPKKLLFVLHHYARKLGIQNQKIVQEPKLALHKGSLQGITSGKKRFEAPIVINATGSWAGTAKDAKMRLPISPARGQILILRGKLKTNTILHSLDGAYIVPWGKNDYLVGSTVEFAGYEPYVTRSGLKGILSRAEKLAPGVQKMKVVNSWAGLRPFPVDRLPVIGPAKIKGLYHAAGYFRSGILIGFTAGELLAQGIMRGKMPKLLAAFNPQRFQNGKH